MAQGKSAPRRRFAVARASHCAAVMRMSCRAAVATQARTPGGQVAWRAVGEVEKVRGRSGSSNQSPKQGRPTTARVWRALCTESRPAGVGKKSWDGQKTDREFSCPGSSRHQSLKEPATMLNWANRDGRRQTSVTSDWRVSRAAVPWDRLPKAERSDGR